MALITKELLKMTKSMAKENTFGMKSECMKESGVKITLMDSEFYTTQGKFTSVLKLD